MAYLSSGKALYDYIENHPGRASACLGHALQDLLSEDQKKNLDELKDDEEPLVEALKDRMSDLLGLFAVPETSAYSPDELFRLVYDGFPAPLSVRVPGKVLESEGFVVDKKGRLAAPDLSLYGALKSLEERWLSPDTFVVYVEHFREAKGGSFDLESFARRSRSAATIPSEGDVREAIESHLALARTYRVRWSKEGPAEELDRWPDFDEPPSQK